MAATDASWYSAGIAIILASVYALKLIRIENFLSKLNLKVPHWLGGEPSKQNLKYEIPIAPTEEEPSASKYTSNWWTDDKQFQLERRAIFSKTWQYVTHASRFQKPGDYRTFDIAGFSFIVILGKDRKLRAFHNVCRHRAYAVTKKESGSLTVLGCRYHGWSYDTRGKLIKAPEFENVAGFDKAMNGLWELKTEFSRGMVFVNFEVGNSEAKFELAESEWVMERWKSGEMKWAHEWKLEGSFNWKLAAGNFFSCKSETKSYWGSIMSIIFRPQLQNLAVSHNTVLRRLASGCLLSVRFLPLSTNKTLIECNIYGKTSRHTKATQLELEKTKKEVDLEVKRLELQREKLLSGDSRFHSNDQDELSEILDQHKEAERRIGKEIHPAARKQSFTEEGIIDDDLCKELEKSSNSRDAVCGANATGLLDW